MKFGAEYERMKAELLEVFARRKDERPFAGLSHDEIEAIKRLPFGEWIRKLLPDWFPEKVPDATFHGEADARRNTLGIPVGNCWFGGAGKTARYVIADAVYDICHGIYYCKLLDGSAAVLPTHDAVERADVVERTRIVLEVNGARNVRKAAEKNGIIRLLLKNSPELKAVYGDAIVPSEGEDAEVDFTANGVRTLAMGIEMSLRGTVHAGRRVQKVRLDDVENNEIAASKEREDKLEDQLFLDWYPRCEGGGQEAVFTMQMNQYRSRHCQARRWKRMSEERDEHGRPKAWFHVVAMDDGQFHSTWPGRYPDEAVKRLHFQIGTVRFNVECRCREVNEDCQINPDWFQIFHADKVAPSELAKMRFVAALDPNHKAGETNDPSAWIVMAGYQGQRLKFIFHAWIKNCTSTKRIEHQWWIEDRFPNAHFVMEDEALTETYGELYGRMCIEARRPRRRIKGVKHTGNKKDRILTDAGDIERGEWHVDPTEGDQAVLLDQYSEIPKEKSHDDGPDACEMASAELDLLLLGADSDEIRVGMPRTDYSALAGVKRQTGVVDTDDEQFERSARGRPLDNVSQFVGI